jgi:hypothetical protein
MPIDLHIFYICFHCVCLGFNVNLCEARGATNILCSILYSPNENVIFEAFTAVKIQVEVFWVMSPCSVMIGYQLLRGPCCLHVHQTKMFQILITFTLYLQFVSVQ